MKVTQQTNN